MGVEDKSTTQPRHHIEPSEELMDKIGLPREAKYDFSQSLIDVIPEEELTIFYEFPDRVRPRGPLRRPQVLWDTVLDALHIEFQTGVESHRQVVDSKRFVDLDERGRVVGIVLRNVSQGVMVQGLPEQRRVNRMLRRRSIDVLDSRVPKNSA